jgi:serine/threonine-protein kinase
MGDVFAAEDEQLGREVAIKRMQTADPDDRQLARFMREARIQGKLQHPAIAPVHELGRDTAGLPFFAMKKLAGTPLDVIFDRADHEQFPRQRLLRAFVDVSLALEYAHVHGVVHRDVKPANMMLGDFGEVYVLDWGVAKIVGETGERFEAAVPARTAEGTEDGSIVGTRAYMSPEQAAGVRDVDARTDIFALGRVLAEILARDPDAPPELATLADRATELEPDARPQRARDVAEGVQRYLDGDRDLALRRKLAAEHLEVARAAFADDRQRAAAMREAGRALALDPELPGAAELVGRLMLEPPREIPPAVVAATADGDAHLERQTARTVLLSHVVFAVTIGVLFAAGATGFAMALAVAAACTAGLAFATMRGPQPSPVWIGLGASVHVAVLSAIGSVIVGGGIASLLVVVVSAHPKVRARMFTPLLAAWMVFAAVAPYLLARAGVLPATFTITSDGFEQHAIALGSGVWCVLLALYILGGVGFGATWGRATRRNEREMRTKLQLQTWQLAQLVAREST